MGSVSLGLDSRKGERALSGIFATDPDKSDRMFLGHTKASQKIITGRRRDR